MLNKKMRGNREREIDTHFFSKKTSFANFACGSILNGTFQMYYCIHLFNLNIKYEIDLSASKM